MPPRQPLKLNKPKTQRAKLGKDMLASLADELLQPEAPEPSQIQPKKPLVVGFSPYPDLTMAITMLAKRQQTVAADGERAKLVSRWLKELQDMQTEMQKLHKLEALANKLGQRP